MKHLLFETDWLASEPVFYNETTGQASHNINDVIDYANLEVHAEGFNNYLDFGYSVLEQTPVKHVKFLRHSSRLWRDAQGQLTTEYLDDPVDRWLDYHLSEDDVIDLLREQVRRWEGSVDGEIIIPTSSGYDSRLLNWCVQDRSRVRSFTYGLSDKQEESHEVVYARKVSEILGTRWERVGLGDYHAYFDDWDRLFGASTHAHGMYHFEFYSKMVPKIDGGNPFLSGIIGDAWAGSVSIAALDEYADVQRLGYSHGMCADSMQSVFDVENSLLVHYWEKQRTRLEEPRLRVVEAMRFKIVLLCYLMRVPRVFQFQSWSPFLDLKIAASMLNLSPERRRGRVWQRDFFHSHGLDVESMNLKGNRQNTLNMQALRRIPVRPLNVNLLREVVNPVYVDWINRNTEGKPWEDMLRKLLQIRRVGGALKRAGFGQRTINRRDAYSAYLVLLPIENLLRRRNQGG